MSRSRKYPLVNTAKKTSLREFKKNETRRARRELNQNPEIDFSYIKKKYEDAWISPREGSGHSSDPIHLRK